MGEIRIKADVELALKPLAHEPNAEKWVRRVIELREKYPFPWEQLVTTRYNSKTGAPCEWEWADYGEDKWNRIYTHPGFCGLLPMSDEVRDDLDSLAESGHVVLIDGYCIYQMCSSYNGGTVISGLEMKPVCSWDKIRALKGGG